MQSHCTKPFKQAFLKNLLLSLQLQQESSLDGAMSLHERKLAVKSSADVAMATARGSGARWSKAILAPSSGTCNKVRRCRRIVIRCHGHKRNRGGVARRVVRRRTMALRKVIPGCQDSSVDEATLLREAMDYVVHLRAQVDVLRRVSAEAVQRSSSSILNLRAVIPGLLLHLKKTRFFLQMAVACLLPKKNMVDRCMHDDQGAHAFGYL